ncbi:MAG: dTDP-4-dehydrorhamnose 3,5-epimerase [Bacteroidales bacterium]|nr:dTDP-4-dehydrorhamnose 3,5-epimerase [Bacteroidales bacterium]
MEFVKTKLKDAYLICSEPLKDNRGLFERLYCKSELKEINFKENIVQINHSVTNSKGSIRGLHYQIPPMAETKFVKCIKGSVQDVIVDIRKDSPTFLNWHSEILSQENLKMMFIPKGFAHGFQTLEDNCELLYFHTEFYDQKYERGIRFDDQAIDIKWNLELSNISERDKHHPCLSINFKGI